jgi:hypothetical protein
MTLSKRTLGRLPGYVSIHPDRVEVRLVSAAASLEDDTAIFEVLDTSTYGAG